MQELKKILLYLFCTFIFSANFYASNKKVQFIISSGSYGGNYYKTGKYLTKVLNTLDSSKYIFTSIESEGSNNNIANLKTEIADFAIVQRNILLKNLYNETEGITNVEVILPLYQEKLIIYIQGFKDIPFGKFANRITTSNIKKIGFVSLNGFTYRTFNILSKLLHVHLRKGIFYVDNYSNLIKMFKEGKIDAIVTFSLPIQELEEYSKAQKVYFNKKDIKLVESRLENLVAVEVDKNKFTLGSWNFLIGLNKSIEKLEENGRPISQFLSESLSEVNERIPQMISRNILLFKNNEYKAFFDGIPVNSNLFEYLGYYDDNKIKYIIFSVLLLLLFISLYYYPRLFFNIKNIYIIWFRFRHIIIGILLVVLLYFISVELLVYSESTFYKELDLKSKLLNLSKKDLHFWLIVRNLTGSDNGMSPLSSLGKILVSFPSYIILIGFFFITISEYIVTIIQKNRKQGKLKVKYKNHIVIIGWNGITNKLIVETLNAIENYRNSSEKITCIVKNPEKILEQYNDIAKLHAKKKIEFIVGEAREEHVLEMANIHLAKTVVLLADDNTKEADEKTLLRALAISRFCNKKNKLLDINNNLIDSIYMIAEINDISYKENLYDADVNEIISTGNYGNNILTQSMLNHGVSKVLDEVLAFNDENEFYQIDLLEKENAHLRNKTFDELLVLLREQKILLVAIKVIYLTKSGEEIIDNKELKRLLKKDGLRKQIIVNPFTETEIKRRTDNYDKLIVFAQSSNELKKGIKKIKLKLNSI